MTLLHTILHSGLSDIGRSGLRIARSRLRVSGSRLRISGNRLRISGRRLRESTHFKTKICR
mgnify:CR=1 FL=1